MDAAGPMGASTTRERAPAAIVASVGIAWCAVVALEVGGEGHVLHHDAIIAGALPVGLMLVLFLLSWQLMVAAMMLPTAFPMIGLFTTVARGDQHPRRSLAAFLGGYAVVWTAFGIVAIIGDAVVHGVVAATPALNARPWLVTGFVLVAAGAAQLLPLTEACLRACRHPFGLLLERYRPGSGGALRLGVDHGLFCLGCCWGLMLVMFAVGVADLAWMAALTAVMVYERIGRRGARVAPWVGVAFMLYGALLVVHPAGVSALIGGTGSPAHLHAGSSP